MLDPRLLPTQRNPLLALDVYKMGHMEQYAPGCNKVFSYLMARSDKRYDKTVFFGLQYYIKEYLCTPLEHWMAEEWLEIREEALGIPNSPLVISWILT
jgi:nicotinamide phosphoribosyltransferase